MHPVGSRRRGFCRSGVSFNERDALRPAGVYSDALIFLILIGSLFNPSLLMKHFSPEAIIANTTWLTELLLSENEVSWKDAREGVEFIRDDLAKRWPTHSAMIRAKFNAWICAQEAGSSTILPFPPRARDIR